MCGPYPARRADLCSLYDHRMQCGPGFFRPVSLPGDDPACSLRKPVQTICQAPGSCCAPLGKEMLRPVATVAHKVRFWSLCGGRENSQKNPLKPRRFGPGRIVAQFRAKCLDFSGASQPPTARAGSGLPGPKPGSAGRHRWLLCAINNRAGAKCRTGAERSGCRALLAKTCGSIPAALMVSCVFTGHAALAE